MPATARLPITVLHHIGAEALAGALAGLTPDELAAFGRDLIATLCDYGFAHEAAAFAAGVAEAALPISMTEKEHG